MNKNIIFHQLFENESFTYTYIVGDQSTREVVLIDPVIETFERDLKYISEWGYTLKFVLDTHIHADHITSAGEMRKKLGVKTGVSARAGVSCADLQLKDGDIVQVGNVAIKVLETPGHTDTCLSFYTNGMVFSGDALLIRGCGRTDFQQGSSERLYKSVKQNLFSLPDDTVVYPAHDYKGVQRSTIALEKKFNPRLRDGISLEQFVETMNSLQLPLPKKIHEAVPANLVCGRIKGIEGLNPVYEEGVPQVSSETLNLVLQNNQDAVVRLIDVRRYEEFNGELGHISGAELVTLGDDLERFLLENDRYQQIVFVCRSGARSGVATKQAQSMGYRNVVNLAGGMLAWNEYLRVSQFEA